MEFKSERKTHVGIGYATQSDAFQCGREAAQMARSHLPEGHLDLALIFAPPSFQFKNFIEGARLVTGETNLIGLTTGQVFHPALPFQHPGVVALLQVPSARLSVVSANLGPDRILPAMTAIFSQLRKTRGIDCQGYDSRGLMFFGSNLNSHETDFFNQATCEAGLDPWITCLLNESTFPFICQKQIISQGVIGIECLTNSPWGLERTNLISQEAQPDAWRDKLRSALEAALSKLGHKQPGFGLLFVDFPEDHFQKNGMSEIITTVDGTINNIPWLGIRSRRHFVRLSEVSVRIEPAAITVILVPS